MDVFLKTMVKCAVSLCAILIGAFFVAGCGFFSEYESDWINQDTKYYTAQELETLFWENEEEFTEVADIILESEVRHSRFSGQKKIPITE